MSQTAEDKQAWVPIIGCFVPLMALLALIAWLLVTSIG